MGLENESGQRTTRFNLIDEPWLTVTSGGGPRAVSLREVFEQAPKLTGVQGELPTHAFAHTRLLLAIAYRALEAQLETKADWARLWEDGLPVDVIHGYLERHRDRFDLLHPETPFYQVANLSTQKGETKGVDQLLADLPANKRLFTNRAGAGLHSLSFAEASRWLVAAQAFEASGIKSGALGDERVSDGKGYPIGVAFAGLLGGILIEGSNLGETLLLNLIPGRVRGWDGEDDPAPWERTQLGAAEERAGRQPRGVVDLLTWPSRRIRLISDGTAITGSLIANGDKLTPQNLHRVETMTAWYRSTPQEKKLGLPLVYMPREHNPGKALWRGLPALLADTTSRATGHDAAAHLVPATLQWLATLQAEETLPPDTRIGIRAIGVAYRSKSSVVSDVIDDRLHLALVVLRQEAGPLAHIAEAALHRAEEAVFALKTLAGNLAAAAGGETDGPRDRAEEAGYAALDAPFRRWLGALGQDSDPEVAYAEWKQQAARQVRELGDSLVEATGPHAWVGREYRGAFINSMIAQDRFHRSLSKTMNTQSVAKETK